MWFRQSAFLNNELSYLKCLSLRRVLNLFKLFGGYFFSRIVQKPKWLGQPYAFSVEPSGHCQLRCPECPTGAAVLTRKKGNIDPVLFTKIINEIKEYTLYLNLYFQGEPLIHPQIDFLIRKADEARTYTTLSTNAQLLDKEMCQKLISSGLSRIVISLDGFSQEIYEQYRRGGNVEKVKNGILSLIEAREEENATNPLVVVQTLAFRHNKNEIKRIRDWCRSVGVDKLEIKSAQMNEFGDGSVKPAKEHSRYENVPAESSFRLRKKAYNHCWRQWSNPVITWMDPCFPAATTKTQSTF